MRIAYMLTSLGIGGAEKQVIEIGERMAARGHDVILIVLKSPETQEWPTTLPVHRLGITKSAPGVIGGFIRARRVLRLFELDLLHSHTLPANMLARVLRGIGVAPPVVSTIHNVYEGGRHRMLAYRITDPLSAHSTAVSRAAADRYIRIRAVPRDKCSVITNGIDTVAFSPERFAATESKESRTADRAFLWLAAGRDVPAKDFDNLLAAFRIVRSAMPHTQLRIAGKPAAHRRAGDQPGFEWLGISTDMPRIITECNGFVLSSAWEGLPLVVAEAMAMQKPVVATDVGGVRELIGNAGFLVPSKSPQALADAMLRAMQMPEPERDALGRQARERILQHFDIDSKAGEWERLYSSIPGHC